MQIPKVVVGAASYSWRSEKLMNDNSLINDVTPFILIVFEEDHIARD